MRANRQLIIFVEPNGFYRHNLAVLTAEQTKIPVKEFVSDSKAVQWFKTEESDSSDVRVVIAHAHFRNEFGEKDYRRTGALFQLARARWPEVALIALATSIIPSLATSGFPENVCFVDIDREEPEKVLRVIDDLLHLCPLPA